MARIDQPQRLRAIVERGAQARLAKVEAVARRIFGALNSARSGLYYRIIRQQYIIVALRAVGCAPVQVNQPSILIHRKRVFHLTRDHAEQFPCFIVAYFHFNTTFQPALAQARYSGMICRIHNNCNEYRSVCQGKVDRIYLFILTPTASLLYYHAI